MGLIEKIEERRRKKMEKKIVQAIQKRTPVEIRIRNAVGEGFYYVCVNDVPVIQEKGFVSARSRLKTIAQDLKREGIEIIEG